MCIRVRFIRVLRSESDDEDIQKSVKTKVDISNTQEDSTNKGGIFQFLQANLLSDTSNKIFG